MKLNFKVLTVFPELIQNFINYGLIQRAITENKTDIRAINLRDFAINTHGQIDDTPYGGGAGMVLRPEPAFAAISKLRKESPGAKVISFSPRGKVLTQEVARRFVDDMSQGVDSYIFLCNRYEGMDQRIISNLVDEEISIGDYILMGSEVAACVLLETIVRLLPGVLGNENSTVQESFSSNTFDIEATSNVKGVHTLLEHSHYTKPATYLWQQDEEGSPVCDGTIGDGSKDAKELVVPEVLLSGNHADIEKFRAEEAVELTVKTRPDLLRNKPFLNNLSVALIHFPVTNKHGEIVTSSVTNLDIHDISRSAKTFGVKHFFIVHPNEVLRKLSEKIFKHWDVGYGSTYNPNRREALQTIHICSYLEEAIQHLEMQDAEVQKKKNSKRKVKIITTSARAADNTLSFAEMKARLRTDDSEHLLLLGTGWGLAQEVMNLADYRLEPINGPVDYNHLSVRAAAAIMFSRLQV